MSIVETDFTIQNLTSFISMVPTCHAKMGEIQGQDNMTNT